MELNKRLQGFMPDNQWKSFRQFCQENGILLDEDALEFGSVFLANKYSFSAGWESAEETEEDKE